MTADLGLRRPFVRTAFVAGCGFVTLGVLLHLPMLLMARHTGWVLAQMPMDAPMITGMALIPIGLVIATYGLLPSHRPALQSEIVIRAGQEGRLNHRHWILLVVLTIGLVIDVMKPASLGFVVPGMRREYGLSREVVALFPLVALTGTFVGSLVWGAFADRCGRKSAILLAALMFVGTTICGAMPAFEWNLGMCFLMGSSAGGMLPVVYALLSETIPARHRGWALVLMGGLGAAGGYLAASGLSALLQPMFGWRVMWLLGLPTGLLLVLMGGLIPESPRFLVNVGRLHEAREVLRRYGATIEVRVAGQVAAALAPSTSAASGSAALVALSCVALAWSMVNFGLLLWLPNELVSRGESIDAMSRMLAKSTLVGLPAIVLVAPLYSRWSTRGTVVLCGGLTVTGLMAFLLGDLVGLPVGASIAILILGSNALLATLLPYAAEAFPAAVRGRATGWVAGCTKFGGIIAQALSAAAIVPALGVMSAVLVAALAAPLAVLAARGPETRGLELDEPPSEPDLQPAQRVA